MEIVHNNNTNVRCDVCDETDYIFIRLAGKNFNIYVCRLCAKQANKMIKKAE